MISETRARQAAFWDQWVCLDCSSTSDRETVEAEGDACPTCGGQHVYQAKLVVTILDNVEADNESA